jgi:hypothetical protein
MSNLLYLKLVQIVGIVVSIKKTMLQLDLELIILTQSLCYSIFTRRVIRGGGPVPLRTHSQPSLGTDSELSSIFAYKKPHHRPMRKLAQHLK